MSFSKLSLLGRLAAGLIAVFAMTNAAFATTCTPGDWVSGFCDLPVAPSPRCVVAPDEWTARAACVSETVGCTEIGGCFGTTPVGHWYPYLDFGVQKRCQCGCFAEETEFSTIAGRITGSEIIKLSSQGGARLLSLDSLFSRSLSERDINGIVFGPEKELVYTLSTENGRKITLSSQHPVLIVNEEGEIVAVKATTQVKIDEFVLGEDGIPDRISTIETNAYDKRMVNFNVSSTDAQNHFVPANGIVLGDNAWQQRLASVDARILLRADLVKELKRNAEASK